MVLPAVALTLIPLYLLIKHIISEINVEVEKNEENDEGNDKENDKENVDVNMNVPGAVKTRSFETDCTLPTVRRSRLDTDCTFDQSIPSIDYNVIPYEHRRVGIGINDDDDDDDDDYDDETGLGRKLKEDNIPIQIDNDSPPPPPPPNLQNVVEFQLPVGFYRLRKAMLDGESTFWTSVIMKDTMNYSRIVRERWSRYHQHIGKPTPPNPSTAITESDFINATRKTSFLMPRTVILKPTMAHEITTLTHYGPHAFTLSTQTRTPSVPFGSKIVNHTQITVTNANVRTERDNDDGDAGKIDPCRMTCSHEVEFPTGPPPMGIGAQIDKQARLAVIASLHKMTAAVRSCVEEEEEEAAGDGRFTDRYSAGEADSFVYDLSLTGGSQGYGGRPTLLARKGGLGRNVLPSVIFANVGSRSRSRSGSESESSVGGGGGGRPPMAVKKKKGAITRMRQWNSKRNIRKSKSERKKDKDKNGGRRKRFKTDTE